MTVKRISYGLPTKPSKRLEHALAYDPKRRAVFQFGGWDFDVTVFDGLWVWYLDQPELGWSLVATLGPRPVARSDMGLVVDTARDRLIMYGGVDVAFAFLNDTWALPLVGVDSGAATWTDLAPATDPTARFPVHMVYDTARDRVVRFGGQNSSFVAQRTTHEFDGTDWADVTPALPADSPPARFGHAMAFDRSRGATVIFGGADTGSAFDDTFLWSGGPTWIEHTGALKPLARLLGPSAYSPRLGGVVVTLGLGKTGAFFGPPRPDTWVLRTTGWQEIHSDARPLMRDSINGGGAETARGVAVHGGLQQEAPFGVAEDTWAIEFDEEWEEAPIGFAYDSAEIAVNGGARLADPSTTQQALISFPPGIPFRGPLAALNVIFTLQSDSRLLIALGLDGDLLYWDGEAWSASDASEAQMSTVADAAANIATFPLAAGVAGLLDPTFRLITDITSTTPELEQVEVDSAFASRQPPKPRLVQISGQIDGEGGEPHPGARLVVAPPTGGGIYHGRTLIGRSTSDESDAAGRLEVAAYETETIGVAMTLQLELGKETRGPVTVEIPDVDRVDLQDLLP